MSFEISCHLRFHVIWICLRLLQNTIEWFRALRPISGWTEGRLSPFDGLLRAPTVLIRLSDDNIILKIKRKTLLKKRGHCSHGAEGINPSSLIQPKFTRPTNLPELGSILLRWRQKIESDQEERKEGGYKDVIKMRRLKCSKAISGMGGMEISESFAVLIKIFTLVNEID